MSGTSERELGATGSEMPGRWKWRGERCHEPGCRSPLFRNGRCTQHWRMVMSSRRKTIDPLEELWRLDAEEPPQKRGKR